MLAGADDRYRARQGCYRIVCSIDDAERLVTVFRIGDRKDVYRKRSVIPVFRFVRAGARLFLEEEIARWGGSERAA